MFQLSSADLKNPLEKETTKLKELKEKVEGKAPGKQRLKSNSSKLCFSTTPHDDTMANASSLKQGAGLSLS